MTAQEIKQLRLDLGLTQQALAEQVGVAVTTVHRWEAGKRRPTTLALRRQLEQLARQVARKAP